MSKKLSKVFEVLKEMKLKRQSNTKGKSHQLWRDKNGKEVQLAPRGDEVPDLYVFCLANLRLKESAQEGISNSDYVRSEVRIS